MSNKRFEMHEIRQVLVQMRLGATDRAIAQSGLMGRKKLAQLRKLATAEGLLDPKTSLPNDSVLAPVFGKPRSRPAVESSVVPWKDLILEWHRDKVPGTAIYAALVRNHHYRGTYSSVRRFLQTYAQEPDGESATVNEVANYIFDRHTASSISFLSHDGIWESAELGEEIPVFAFLASELGEITSEDMSWAKKKLSESVRQ